ncbi:actin-related protein 2/3 complex subunit 3, partial [Kipferlia bialata]|eukprot:g13378.t1
MEAASDAFHLADDPSAPLVCGCPLLPFKNGPGRYRSHEETDWIDSVLGWFRLNVMHLKYSPETK